MNRDLLSRLTKEIYMPFYLLVKGEDAGDYRGLDFYSLSLIKNGITNPARLRDFVYKRRGVYINELDLNLDGLTDEDWGILFGNIKREFRTKRDTTFVLDGHLSLEETLLLLNVMLRTKNAIYHN